MESKSSPTPVGRNGRSRAGYINRFVLSSLLLSLVFFLWWFGWPLLSLHSGLENVLQRLWGGLPLWFWLSCVASLFLLFFAAVFFLPKKEEYLNEDPDGNLNKSLDKAQGRDLNTVTEEVRS
ncbi:hypothetical protein P0082_00760 [Candidatus Haliotispira prima]|uniref:Uncharacterized protein n=1 Tax=Candidatus Haliotispira prima TaxID=3034016 RepID=A0ABY8MHJ9_9SPIO|nr:hypothetical protein P0082_00760 [Candidatus Haliotispira prima]